jgi:hypothetical protein
LLALRIVVNGNEIYECREQQPLVIKVGSTNTQFVVSNGFHVSRIVKVSDKPGPHFYEVESCIDNIQLITGFLVSLLFFIIYILSWLHFFLLIANLPLLTMVYLLFVLRHKFIRVYSFDPAKINS